MTKKDEEIFKNVNKCYICLKNYEHNYISVKEDLHMMNAT